MLHGDIKAQAEIAQQAQQSYEDELVKHAAAAQGLQAVRREYNELRMEVAGVRAEAEAARGSLERGEESWAEQREGLERELEEAKRRRVDVDAQNGVLHRQMESFSAELAALRQGRNHAAPDGGDDGEAAAAGSPARDGNLQEVVRFLRREKEIVDVQYELSMQEAKRLQQQLEYTSATLEATRQTLTDERRKAAEKTREEGSVTSLQQTINELNLHRESATTLRNEARVAREKLEEKVREIERLAAEIEPLQARVGELEGEVEAKAGELGLLQRDRDHWRERTQNINSKYDRVDPAEVVQVRWLAFRTRHWVRSSPPMDAMEEQRKSVKAFSQFSSQIRSCCRSWACSFSSVGCLPGIQSLLQQCESVALAWLRLVMREMVGTGSSREDRPISSSIDIWWFVVQAENGKTLVEGR